jgi:Cu-Zn family superoxide dismutase
MESNAARAICVLNNPDLKISGIIKFEDNGVITKISVNFTGLAPGKHGIHIHEFGNLSNGCVTAGGHYNPYKKTHGAHGDTNKHLGDLGNLFADEHGNVDVIYIDKLIKLTGDYSIVGRSVVIHESEDDLGKGGFSDSLTTGHSGGRIACGIIGITNTF